MHVTRFDAAPEYHAPRHVGMRCVRLQGHEAGSAQQLWLGVSIIEPGGHTGLDASPMEKHYVVLEGELTLVGHTADGVCEALLARHDSCRFAPGERRQLVNHGQRTAMVLLAMPFEPSPPGRPKATTPPRGADAEGVSGANIQETP